MTATGTMERRLAPLGFKPGVVAAIVIDPQPEEKAGDQKAIGQGGGDEVHLLREKGVLMTAKQKAPAPEGAGANCCPNR
jgi:hypothetical protein